jgi:hypothetical protein
MVAARLNLFQYPAGSFGSTTLKFQQPDLPGPEDELSQSSQMGKMAAPGLPSPRAAPESIRAFGNP